MLKEEGREGEKGKEKRNEEKEAIDSIRFLKLEKMRFRALATWVAKGPPVQKLEY